MIVCGIAHLHLSGTKDVARVRTARNGAEDVAVEDVYIGDADDMPLLTAAVYEVGRHAVPFLVMLGVSYAARPELSAVHLWVRAFYVFSKDDFGVAVNIALHTITGAVHVERRILRIL